MKHLTHRTVIALTAAVLPFTSALAQNEDDEEFVLAYGDKTMISLATGSQQPLRRAPAVASVITAEDIAAMGARDLDQVLNSVPGIHVARNSVAYAPIISFRGIYSAHNPQTLMLLNGIPTTTLFTGSIGNVWGGYPLENVARIEVIRGPGSALYGADAYAGVINIITKTADDLDGTELGLRLGTEHTQDTWVSHGGNLGPIRSSAYLRLGSTDGSDQIISQDAARPASVSYAPGRINSGNRAVDANLDLALDNWRWRVNYKLRDDVGTGAGIVQALDPIGKAKSERLLTDLSWNSPQFTRHWGLGATASYMEYNDTVRTPFYLRPVGQLGFPDGMIGAPEKWERQLRLSAFATYSGFDQHAIRVGIGHDDLNLYRTRERKNFDVAYTPLPTLLEATAASIFMLPQKRTVNYLYAQDEWHFSPDWAVTAGVRRDLYSESGGTTNPRLALVWNARYNLTAKLLHGRAFRAPSFVEQFSINNPVAQGNPWLRPETIQTTEAVLNWQPNRETEISINVFHYEMSNIIRIPVGGTTYTNTGSQIGNGMEMEGHWRVNRRLNLSASLAHQRSIDQATQQDAGYAPRNTAYLRADWQAADWQLSAQANRVADRKRPAGDARRPIPDYTTVDLTARTRLGHDWQFMGSIRNLFDAKVLEPSLAPGLAIPNDLPMPGRTLYFQLQYKLN